MARNTRHVLFLGLSFVVGTLATNPPLPRAYVHYYNQTSTTQSALPSGGTSVPWPPSSPYNSNATNGPILSLVNPTPVQSNIPTLTATPAPGHDRNDLTYLRPETNGTMYYGDPAEDENNDVLLVELTQAYKYPTVNLAYSSHCKEIVFEKERVVIFFVSDAAFLLVQEQWKRRTDLVLIGSPDHHGHQDWFHCDSFSFDRNKLSVEARGRKTDLKSCVDTFDLNWGRHRPCRHGKCGDEDEDEHPEQNPSCGAPPSPTLGGLPLASCGPGFDATLDNMLGTYDFTAPDVYSIQNTSAFREFVPGYANAPKCLNGSLVARGWFSDAFDAVAGVVETVVDAVVETGEDIVSGVGNAISDIGSWFAGAFKDIGGWLGNAVKWILSTFVLEPSITLPLPINIGPAPETSSPWGSAFKFWDCGNQCRSGTVALYCVKCGFHGNLYTTGSVRISPIIGLIGGTVRIRGDLTAGVNLGLDANGLYNDKILSKRLAGLGIPGFSIPGVITLGPELTLDIDAYLNVKAKGRIQAGLNFDWSRVDARIDLGQPWNSYASGFKPSVRRVFQGSGQISADASIGLPLGIRFGISLLNGAFALQAGIVERPGVGIEANYHTRTCSGIGWAIKLLNDVLAVYPGGEKNLDHSEYTVASDCYRNVPSRRGISGPSEYTRRSLVSRNSTHGVPGRHKPGFCVNANPNPAINTTTIRDTTGAYSLVAGYDGNLWLGNSTTELSSNLTSFSIANRIIVGDAAKRLLHYYPREMDHFGVSRIRLSPLESTPKTSEAISLVPTSYAGSNSILTAIDTVGRAYFLAWCGLPSQGAKIFLVKQPTTGVSTLMNVKELVWAVLGGIPGECNLAGLTSNVAGY